MAHIFNRIISGGYWVTFGTMSPQQQECKTYTASMLEELLAVRQREKYVSEVKACICGYPPADEAEPMVPENFSQYQFYLPIEREIVAFVDRFDYLVCCVANGICKIHKGFEERYERALLTVMTFRTAMVPSSPQQVLDPQLMVAPGPVYSEQNRSPAKQAEEVESYLSKQDPYSRAVKEELLQLEAEEAAAEHRRREEADRAAGHNPYKVTEQEAETAAEELTKAEEDAVMRAAQHASVASSGLIVHRPAHRVPKDEDPTPVMTLVLTVKAEMEAREELERRRADRKRHIQEAADTDAKEKREKKIADEAARVKAEEEAIAQLTRDRIEAERIEAEAQRQLDIANKQRDVERTKMAAQLAAQAASEDAKRLEEANERERVARLEAEKASKRRAEAAAREAVAREAAAKEFRRQELEAGRQALIKERLLQEQLQREDVDRAAFLNQRQVDDEERAAREGIIRAAGASAADALASQ